MILNNVNTCPVFCLQYYSISKSLGILSSLPWHVDRHGDFLLRVIWNHSNPGISRNFFDYIWLAKNPRGTEPRNRTKSNRNLQDPEKKSAWRSLGPCFSVCFVLFHFSFGDTLNGLCSFDKRNCAMNYLRHVKVSVVKLQAPSNRMHYNTILTSNI